MASGNEPREAQSWPRRIRERSRLYFVLTHINPPIIPSHYSDDRKEWIQPHLYTESIESIIAPGIVILKRDDDYSVKCHLPGYKDSMGQISHHLVNWDYLIFGNLFAFALIPGFIADYTTGAANHLGPVILDIQMTPTIMPGYPSPTEE